jgi:hypothetical protein
MKKSYFLLIIVLLTIVITGCGCKNDKKELNGKWITENKNVLVEIENSTHITVKFKDTASILIGEIKKVNSKKKEITIEWDNVFKNINYKYSLYSSSSLLKGPVWKKNNKLKISGGEDIYVLNLILDHTLLDYSDLFEKAKKGLKELNDKKDLNGKWITDNKKTIVEIDDNTHITVKLNRDTTSKNKKNREYERIIKGKITEINLKEERIIIKWDFNPSNDITYNCSLYSNKFKIVGGEGDYALDFVLENFILNTDDIDFDLLKDSAEVLKTFLPLF